jgi:hypothetical protein
LSEDIYYVQALVPVVVLVDSLFWRSLTNKERGLGIMACIYFLLPRLESLPYLGRTDIEHLMTSGMYLYGLILVVTALVYLYYRRGKTADGPEIVAPLVLKGGAGAVATRHSL